MNKTVTEYEPYGKILREYNPQAEMFKYQSSQEDQELGIGSYYTHFRGLDVDIVRWKQIDPAVYYGSPYKSMNCNPIMYNDLLGDSSVYYSSSGTLLHTSYDALKNAVVIIQENSLNSFENALTKGAARGANLDSENFNNSLRGFGDSYMIEGMFSFFDKNSNDFINAASEYKNEHGTYLYAKEGEIRVGNENFKGSVEFTIYGSNNIGGTGSNANGAENVTRLHTHPNIGLNNDYGIPYQPNASDQDWEKAPVGGRYSRGVVSQNQLNFYSYPKINGEIKKVEISIDRYNAFKK